LRSRSGRPSSARRTAMRSSSAVMPPSGSGGGSAMVYLGRPPRQETRLARPPPMGIAHEIMRHRYQPRAQIDRQRLPLIQPRERLLRDVGPPRPRRRYKRSTYRNTQGKCSANATRNRSSNGTSCAAAMAGSPIVHRSICPFATQHEQSRHREQSPRRDRAQRADQAEHVGVFKTFVSRSPSPSARRRARRSRAASAAPLEIDALVRRQAPASTGPLMRCGVPARSPAPSDTYGSQLSASATTLVRRPVAPHHAVSRVVPAVTR